MPVGSYTRELLDYGFPAPPQSHKMVTDSQSWIGPGATPSDFAHHDSHFADKSPLTTNDQIEHTICRLSSIRNRETDTQPSLRYVSSASSSVSTTGKLDTSPPPTRPPSLVRQSPKSSPSFDSSLFATSHSQRSMQAQIRTTTNRKMARVRPDYRSSQLRTEVGYDLDTQLDRITEPSRPSTIPGNYILKAKEPGRASTPVGNPLSNRCINAWGPQNYPTMSRLACIRTPQRTTWSERAAEDKYRFPSRHSLQENGHPCSSVPCSAPNSLYGTPIESPFATPPGSPSPSAGPSLHHIMSASSALEETKLDTETSSNRCSTDYLENYQDDAQPGGPAVPYAEVRASGTIYTNNRRTDFTYWDGDVRDVRARATQDWEKTVDSSNLPSRSRSIASSDLKVQPGRPCALLGRLKGVFRWRKVRSVASTTKGL